MRDRRGWTSFTVMAAALLAAGCGTASGTGPATTQASAGTSTSASAAPAGSRSPAVNSSPPRPAAGSLWLQALRMSTPRTGWALYLAGNPSTAPLGTPTLLVRTTDAARTWTDITPAASRPMLSTSYANQVLDAISTDRAYLAVTVSPSEGGPGTTRVFATRDGGRTWTESAAVKAVGYASGLSFTDPSHGWLLWNEGAAMGRNPVRVYRTTDGGAHWSLSAQSPPIDSNSGAGIPVPCDKTGITFASAATGWLTSVCAVGLADGLLVSRDGGETWSQQQLPLPAGLCGQTACELNGPEFTGGTGFLTLGRYAGAPALLVSRDLGQSWASMPLPTGSGAYPQIRFFDPRRGVLVAGGSQGTFGDVFYTTSDGGQTWTAVPQGTHFTANGAAIGFVSPETGFAWIQGGDAQGDSPPPIYETTDSGRTWTSFNPLVTG